VKRTQGKIEADFGRKSSKNVAKLKCSGTTLKKLNCIQKEIRSTMNQGCRQPFGSVYSVFQFATQKYKDYNLACCFI
jgi:hypothetical protein